MPSVSFFTPITFRESPKGYSKKLLETIDDYFYLRGKKAYVIETTDQKKQAVLCKDKPSPCLVTALKVASYATIIIPIVVLIFKAILRSIHKFELLDTKQKLEEGIDISPEILQELERLLPSIQRREQNDQIHWHPTGNDFLSGNDRIFSLAAHPNLIFKTAITAPDELSYFSADQRIERSFTNTLLGYEACLANPFDRLIVPRTKKFTMGDLPFIAQERLNIAGDEEVQERLYQELRDPTPLIQQLTAFIARTGFSDVNWRTIPLTEELPEFQNLRKVALIDLKEMENARTGIFGTSGRAFDLRPDLRPGLISCLCSEEQIDLAIKEIRDYGITPSKTNKFRTQKRLEKLQQDQNVKQSMEQAYERNGISQNPTKPIPIEVLDTLGLDLDRESTISRLKETDGVIGYVEERIHLRTIAEDIIRSINEQIEQSPDNAPVKERRKVLAQPEQYPWNFFDGLGATPGVSTEAEFNRLFPGRVINALIEKGHLFHLSCSPRGYLIQA